MTSTPARPSPGLRVGPIIGGAIVLGLVGGVGLSTWKQARIEAELQQMDAVNDQQALAVDPVRPTSNPEVDPYAPDPAVLGAIPVYPGSKPRDLMRRPRTQGVPMAIAWLTTPDPVEDVVRFYDAAFWRAHLMHETHRYGANSAYVAWFEEDKGPDAGLMEGTLHMVSVLRQNGETVVLLSNTDPRAIMSAKPPQPPPGVVFPPGAGRAQLFELGEGPGSRVNIHAPVVMGNLATVRDFYRKHYSQAPWQLTADRDTESGATLEARRPGEEHIVSLVKREDRINIIVTYVAHTP